MQPSAQQKTTPIAEQHPPPSARPALSASGEQNPKTDLVEEIARDMEGFEKGSTSLVDFVGHLGSYKDEEITAHIERISRGILKRLNSETDCTSVMTFAPRLLKLFENSRFRNAQLLVALMQNNSKHIAQNADVIPRLAIKWLSLNEPSLDWIIEMSRLSSRQLHNELFLLDPQLIVQQSHLIQRIADELTKTVTVNQQQRDFLFKLLTRSFNARSELIESVSSRLVSLCSRLPITTNLELSISFLKSLKGRTVESVETGRALAKKLEQQTQLRDQKQNDVLRKGLNLFVNGTLPPVAELIPLLAVKDWKVSLMGIILMMSEQSLLQGIFENPQLCLYDHTELDDLFRAKPSLIFSISTLHLSDQAILDGSGVLRRVSNSWLMTIPPKSNQRLLMRQVPLVSTKVTGNLSISCSFYVLIAKSREGSGHSYSRASRA